MSTDQKCPKIFKQEKRGANFEANTWPVAMAAAAALTNEKQTNRKVFARIVLRSAVKETEAKESRAAPCQLGFQRI